MPDTVMSYLPHLLTLLFFTSMIFTRWSLQRRNSGQNARDAMRLASGLRAELQALLSLYEENLALIEQRAPYILSVRSGVNFYRGNVARLPAMLDHQTLASVVAAFSNNERVEAYLARASNTPNRGNVYQIKPRQPRVEVARQNLARGTEVIKSAIGALDRCCCADKPARIRGVFRWRLSRERASVAEVSP